MSTGVIEATSPLRPDATLRLAGAAQGMAARMPTLRLAASRLAASLSHGLHGRKRAGNGEDFWQYRRFMTGESAAAIDWRRSARGQHLHVREKEWEAAHTVWIWVDTSPSMQLASALAQCPKAERALVLGLALAQMLVDAGERVGFAGLTRPSSSRFAVDSIALALGRHGADTANLPPPLEQANRSELVIIGDLLAPAGEMAARIRQIGARPHLLMVLDPAEEQFSFTGRTQFIDPETGAERIIGRAEDLREAYEAALAAHKDALRTLARSRDGSFIGHHTDRAATEPLLALINQLGAPPAVSGGM